MKQKQLGKKQDKVNPYKTKKKVIEDPVKLTAMKYMKFFRIFIPIGLALTAVSWYLSRKSELSYAGTLSIVLQLISLVLIVAALYIDYTKVRPWRNKVQGGK